MMLVIAFAAPYLASMTEDALQREHSLREVFNSLRSIARVGYSWRVLSNDMPPWYIIQQTQ